MSENNINAQPWDADIRAHPLFIAAPADGSGDSALAESLNAITVEGPKVGFQLSVAIAILAASTNFSWSRILQRARGTASLPPVTMIDAAIIAAQNVTSHPETVIIDESNTALWSAFLNGLNALLLAEDVTLSEVEAIKNLPNSTIPWWQSINATSPLNEHDIARARNGAI